jgi:hypothetical protein
LIVVRYEFTQHLIKALICFEQPEDQIEKTRRLLNGRSRPASVTNMLLSNEDA